MEINEFVKNFANEFEETPTEQFTPQTEFRELDEWDSLASLSIISMVDDHYNVTISNDDIKSVKTIEELFELVKGKA